MRRRTDLVIALGLAVFFSGCVSQTETTPGETPQEASELHPGHPPFSRTFPFNLTWGAFAPSHSFVAVKVHLPNETEWRASSVIDAEMRNATVWWKSSFFIHGHDGHQVVEATGMTNSFPVCEVTSPGPVYKDCEPDTFRENISGARQRTSAPGTVVFVAAMYGATDSRTLKMTIESEREIQLASGQTGKTELLVLDDGREEKKVDATVNYTAAAPVLGNFQGIRAPFDQFIARHESGLELKWERGAPHENGDWYIGEIPVGWRIFSGPAGNWTFTARGDRATDSTSSPVVGILVDPFFVSQNGTLDGDIAPW